MRQRVKDVRLWLRRKTCRHPNPPNYEEIRTKIDGRLRISWSAFYACPDCGEVVGVEASYYGNPYRVAEAIDEEIDQHSAEAREA